MNHTGLFLLPSLFYYTPDKEIKYCWNNKYKTRFNHALFNKSIDEPTDDQTKFVFGIRNGRVWKSKFDEKISNTNFSSENSDELNKENNKWEYERFYEIPEDYELISISKYDKVYLFSNDYIYEWNINTEKSVKIFGNNKDKNKVINIITWLLIGI